jgi:hypothetical protein
MPAKASSGNRSISRIDSEKSKTFGWYVRVRWDGRQRVKFVPDARYEGREAAKAAAISFRDEAERELGKPQTDRLVVAKKRAGASGIVGVQRQDHYFVVTSQPEPGRVRRRFVRIKPGRERSALNEACRLRRQAELALYDETIKPNWDRALAVLVSGGK